MRTRTIKPEFWYDEKLARVSREARLFFIGLWTIADDQGVTHSNSVFLKSQIFPYDDIKNSVIEQWIKDFVSLGMLIPYQAENLENYLFIRTFPKYQKIDHPAKTQFNPAPREGFAKVSENFREVSRKTVRQTETETETETETNTLRSSERSSFVYPSNFQNLWDIYPIKRNKSKAYEIYKKIKPSIELQKQIIKSINSQIAVKAQLDLNKVFCPEFPYLERWIKHRKWEDQVKTLEEIEIEERKKLEDEFAKQNH